MRGMKLLWMMPSLLAGCHGTEPPSAAPASPSTKTASQAPWNGEIRVRFTGCSSCADCRSAIRQISRSQSGSDHVEVRPGMARITYPGPASIRAAEVAKALSSPGVIKGEVDQVEVKAEGLAEQGPGGKTFVVTPTGQRWGISEEVVLVPVGKPVIIVAALSGWQDTAQVPTLKILSVELP